MTYDGNVTYLSNGTVYVVTLPRGSGSATKLISSWQLPQLHDRVSYAGLSRRPNDSALFHGSWISRAAEAIHVNCEIIQANVRTHSLGTIQANTPHRLTWPVLSPSGTSIAATAIVQGKGSLRYRNWLRGQSWNRGRGAEDRERVLFAEQGRNLWSFLCTVTWRLTTRSTGAAGIWFLVRGLRWPRPG